MVLSAGRVKTYACGTTAALTNLHAAFLVPSVQLPCERKMMGFVNDA